MNEIIEVTFQEAKFLQWCMTYIKVDKKRMDNNQLAYTEKHLESVTNKIGAVVGDGG